MNLSEPFIKRPVMTTLVMLSLVFFGLFSYFRIPVSDLPNVEFPTIEVNVSYPGANPETMANTVATPLEKEFMTIDGLSIIVSSNKTGSSILLLQFSLEKSLDTASLDVEAAISRALPNLPQDLPYNPSYKKVNPAQTPIFYMAITSSIMDQAKLYDYANTFIGQRLSTLEGVSQVITYGSPFAARIQVDPQKLAAKNIGINEVAKAIQMGNVDLPTGVLFGPKREYTIDVAGQLYNADEYNSLVIKAQDGALVKVSDVGRALNSLQDDKFSLSLYEKDTKRSCVVLAIQTLPGSNTIDVTQNLERVLPNIQKFLPASLEYTTIFKKSDIIQNSVDEVKITVFVAFLLVVLIIYFTLGKVFNTIIPSLAIPMSLLGTLPFLFLGGFSLDILSLLAFTLSIGFLVDDAIVVLENNVRHVQMGKDPFSASLEGSKEISTTIFSMTLCLAAVFIPMLFMAGIMGKLFREFSVTIIIAVLLSGFISLTLTPLLCSRFIPKQSKQKTKMEIFADLYFSKMLSVYEKGLHWSLRNTLLLFFIGTLSLIGSFLLASVIPKDFLPIEDQGFIQGFTQTRDGTSPFAMDAYQDEVAKIVADNPFVQSCISVSSVSGVGSDNQGFLFVSLKPFKKRPPIFPVIGQIMGKTSEIPGINTYLSPLPTINLQIGITLKGLYQFTLSSLNAETLYEAVPKFMQSISSIEGITQVSSDLQISQPQLQIEILRHKASDLGLTAQDIQTLFGLAYSDNKISTINTPINQYDVILETLPQFYKDPNVLSSLYLKSQNNVMVPVKEIIKTKEWVGPLAVNHVNALPSATVSFNLKEGVPLGSVLSKVEEIAKETLPSQVIGKSQGSTTVFQASFESLPFLFLITIFVIYVILGILYESFIHPLTVLSALFPATFGGFLTLYIAREALSLYSFVGMILLIGIVMKNGIMMVDFANHALSQGKKAYDSIIEASLIRFRPIFMTSISALMGAVPIAIGIGGSNALSRRPLGMVIIGGLIFSQILTLFLTPVIYYSFERIRERFQEKKRS